MQLEQVEQVDERAPGYFARMIEKALLFALGISIALATLAQTPSVDDIDAAIKVRGEHIDKISRQISAAGVSNSDLDGWLDTLIGYQGDFNTYADQLQAALAVPAGKLNELGPPPADGQPPESADITRTRKQLTDQVSRLDGLSKRVHLEDGSIGQLIGRARSLQRDRYMSSIQTRSALPFSAQHWATASADVEPALSRFSGHFEDVWRDQRAAGTLTANVVLLLMALGLAIGLFVLPRLPQLKQFAPRLFDNPSPSALEKKRSASFRVLGYGLLFSGSGALLLGAAVETGWFAKEYGEFALRIWLSGITLVVVWNYVTCVFSPHDVEWRSVPIDSLRAARLRYLLLALIALFCVDRIVFTAIQLTNSGVQLASVFSILTNSLFAVLLWLSCGFHFWRSAAISPPGQAAGPDPQASATTAKSDHSGNPAATASVLALWQIALLLAGRTLAVIILLLTGLGYLNLANFLFHRIVLFALLVIFARTVRTLARWGLYEWLTMKHLAAAATLPQAPPGASQHPDTDGDPGFWMGLTIDLLWLSLCIPAFLLVVGFDWLDLERWLSLLNSDIEVGQFSVSFVATLTALLVLLFGNVLTRRLTVMLDVRLGQRAHMGSGERASIITLVNYTGMVVAILLALGILGIGWTQVAIIAGALSVGIGFGLQGIVNNFVSGLILLFERPVKVGDWIVVQSGEGYVRHIGARATEIETFDRSSIIIPNAEMITGAVENWFYKTRRGRIRIKVGVAYDSDPEQVRKILLDCAARQSNVVNYPYAPRVRWLEFGDSSLEFELIAFIVDIDNGATTRSDLHFAIFKALKDVGITIPFPQRDLHIVSGEAPAGPPDIPDEPPHN